MHQAHHKAESENILVYPLQKVHHTEPPLFDWLNPHHALETHLQLTF